MEKKNYNILLILTGGTICSFADERGEREADTERALTLVVKNFGEGDCVYKDRVDFDPKMPLDILSENMTTVHWNTLIKEMKGYDFSFYDGVIILHGTDTLAYTSSLLSLLLAGIKVPVFLVSSQLPLYMKEANGNANFKAAVEMIVNGTKPNVYVAYENREGEKKAMFVHYGAHLLQCRNHSESFFSEDMIEVSRDNACFEGRDSGDGEMLLYRCGALSSCVLKIEPYVGINYDFFSLDGVRAVLHGTYHSSTMPVNPYEKTEVFPCGGEAHSVLSLKKRCDCRDVPVPLFVEPCNPNAYAYETTGELLRSGAVGLWGITSEMAYVKLLLGCSMTLEKDELERFVMTEINGEFVRRQLS